jgi:hypothetical protein
MSCLPLSNFAHWCCFPPATPTGGSLSRCPSRAFPIQISHATRVLFSFRTDNRAHTAHTHHGRRAAAKQRKAHSARHPRHRSPKRRHKIARDDHRRRLRRRRLHRSTTAAALLTFFTGRGEGQGVMRCTGDTPGTVRLGVLACCAWVCARFRHALSGPLTLSHSPGHPRQVDLAWPPTPVPNLAPPQ